MTEQRSAPSAWKSTGDVAGGRARVDVHDGAALAGGRADLRRRLQRADLVIRELDRHELRVGAHRVDHLGRVEAARAVDADERDLGAATGRSRRARSNARPRSSRRGPRAG